MKLMRGRFSGTPAKEEMPLGRKTHEGRYLLIQSRAGRRMRTLAGSKTLEWGSSDQPQEGTGNREVVLLRGWKSTLKGNPMGGTGMKQGRQRMGGSRPREREKR